MSTTALAGLLDQAARRDAGAFAAFYDGTIGEAYLLARMSAVGAGDHEVERIVREAYCAAWHECGSFALAGMSPTAWLMSLVRRVAGGAESADGADTGRTVLAAVGTGPDEPAPHDTHRPRSRARDGRLHRHRAGARTALRG